MKEKYFAASNSSNGFCSYYDGIFSIKKLLRIYVIKGGSGTGKAFFMKEVASCAEKKGYSVRYIYCSSDSKSLDGVIINELSIAVLDGTSPHVYEPKILGAAETIVDLGRFLDERILSGCRKKIECIYDKKKNGFEKVYRYLRAYSEINENINSLVAPAVKREKLSKYINRFVEVIESGEGKEENLLVRAIGMRGLSSFDTYFDRAKIYYAVNDYFDTAYIFMRELYSALKEKHVDMIISNNPIISSKIDALEIVENGLVFEITNDHSNARTVNMKRFIDNEYISNIRTEYRTIVRARDSMLRLALDEFERIKEFHFTLEKIYGAAMDFGAKEEFTREFCNKIFEKN